MDYLLALANSQEYSRINHTDFVFAFAATTAKYCKNSVLEWLVRWFVCLLCPLTSLPGDNLGKIQDTKNS